MITNAEETHSVAWGSERFSSFHVTGHSDGSLLSIAATDQFASDIDATFVNGGSGGELQFGSLYTPTDNRREGFFTAGFDYKLSQSVPAQEVRVVDSWTQPSQVVNASFETLEYPNFTTVDISDIELIRLDFGFQFDWGRIDLFDSEEDETVSLQRNIAWLGSEFYRIQVADFGSVNAFGFRGGVNLLHVNNPDFDWQTFGDWQMA